MLKNHRLRFAWLMPLLFFQAYLALSVFLFFFGPWPWDVDDPIRLLSYLLASQLFIAAGYLFSGIRLKKIKPSDVRKAAGIIRGRAVLRIALVVSMVLLVPTSISRTGQFPPDVAFGLSSPGLAYNLNFDRLSGGNALVIIEYLRILLSPLLIAVFPLTIIYWRYLGALTRAAAVVVILFTLSLFIATGTNKGVADFVVTTPWLVYLAIAAGTLRLRMTMPVRIGIVFVLFVLFLQFFGAGQMQREGGVAENSVFNTGFGIVEADTASVALQTLTENQRIIFESIARYVTSGYYALSMSFDLDASSTFGLGSSMFLARNADSIFGTDAFSRGSLPGALEEETGWGMFELWHSIYPWLASDFGFIGGLVLMGAFGYLLGLGWGKSISCLSWRWIVMTYLMIILFYYVPANNQIFQTGETCVAFILILMSIFFKAMLGRAAAVRARYHGGLFRRVSA